MNYCSTIIDNWCDPTSWQNYSKVTDTSVYYDFVDNVTISYVCPSNAAIYKMPPQDSIDTMIINSWHSSGINTVSSQNATKTFRELVNEKRTLTVGEDPNDSELVQYFCKIYALKTPILVDGQDLHELYKSGCTPTNIHSLLEANYDAVMDDIFRNADLEVEI
jgi:hypothetical protein